MRRVLPLAVGAALLLLLPLGAIEPRTWLTLTVAGLAMGMLIFLVASGLTLIFGLMDVLNFAHGALFSWGAYAGFTRGGARSTGAGAGPPRRRAGCNALLLLLAVAAAVAVAFALGVALERVIVRPVYGQHLFQILITLGATIVLEELIRDRVGTERPGDAGARHLPGLVGRGRRGGAALPRRSPSGSACSSTRAMRGCSTARGWG